MGLFSRPQASLENPSVPLSSAGLLQWLTGPPVYSGALVNEVTSLGVPAVWRAVNLIASGSASLPLHAFKPDNTGFGVQQTTGQAAELLADPHPDLSPFELWELVYCSLLLWGNAYLRILRDRLGVIKELWFIAPNRCKAGRTSVDGSKVYQLDNGDVGLTDREILHIPGFGYDGICGVAPITAARQGLGLTLAAEEFGARFFGNGSMSGGILQTDQRLQPAQADALKRAWESKHKGLPNAHEIAVLDSGAKFQPMTIPPNDAQFLETRKFQVGEIARLFGVPPHLLMDTDRSTSWGTGIEQQQIGFVVFTLRPWLTRVEQRLTKLVQPGNVYVKYSVEGLLRGDTAQRYASYAQGRQWGWLSVNDVRRLEDLPPVPDGDDYWQPLNMVPITSDPEPDQEGVVETNGA